MAKPGEPAEIVARWMAIATLLKAAVRGRSEQGLSARAAPDRLSIRETVHHLVEANLVAASLVIAALSKDGATYDWTWLTPGGSWMRRLGYDRAPVAPAIATLAALGRHVGALLALRRGSLRCTVELFDAPGAPHYTKTVAQVLQDEVAHAAEHLAALPPRARRGPGRRHGGKLRRGRLE